MHVARSIARTEWMTEQELQDHLRLATDPSGSVMTGLLRASLQAAEAYAGRAYSDWTVTETWSAMGDDVLPAVVRLLVPSVPSSITLGYTDTAGGVQTLSPTVDHWSEGEGAAYFDLGRSYDLLPGSQVLWSYDVGAYMDERDIVTQARLIIASALYDGEEPVHRAVKALLDVAGARRGA